MCCLSLPPSHAHFYVMTMPLSLFNWLPSMFQFKILSIQPFSAWTLQENKKLYHDDLLSTILFGVFIVQSACLKLANLCPAACSLLQICLIILFFKAHTKIKFPNQLVCTIVVVTMVNRIFPSGLKRVVPDYLLHQYQQELACPASQSVSVSIA